MSVDISDLAPVIEPDIQSGLVVPNRLSRQKRYKNAITMFVIFLINLLNYMDRFTIAGVLSEIQKSFKIGDGDAGLLQTLFIVSYMTLAPLFGYLGDRYSRKLLIIVGVSLWSLTTLAGSFVPDNLFWLFALSRCFVGVGEASYSCVSPTIIADMYKFDMRTAMLALFNIAVPLGSGLGYIVGAQVTQALGDWRWALRITPVFGVVCVILLIFLVDEPVRGSMDGGQGLKQDSWFYDVVQTLKVKSFILTTLGFTWVAFTIGAVSWWGPKFLQLAHAVHDNGTTDGTTNASVSLYFGIVTCAAGFFGVLIGSELGRRYRKRNERGDPIVCGVAVLLSIPFLVVVLLFSKDNLVATWICVFTGITLLCSNWALITDMLMYIIIPTRRSTASAIQMFMMHFFGDASSPYIVGLISNYFQNGTKGNLIEWTSLRNGLLLAPIISALGGIAFLMAAIYIIDDRYRAENNSKGMNITNNFHLEEPAASL